MPKTHTEGSLLWRERKDPQILKIIHRSIYVSAVSLCVCYSRKVIAKFCVARSSIDRGNTNREWQPIYFAFGEKFATRKYRFDCWQAKLGRICRGPSIFVLSWPFVAASRSSRLTFHCGKQLPHFHGLFTTLQTTVLLEFLMQ